MDSLDRAALGRIVFADDTARRDLEAIIHPGVFRRLQEWFKVLEVLRFLRFARPSPSPMCHCSSRPAARTIRRRCCRGLPPDQQVDRLMARDGLSETEARQRIAAQQPVDEKRARGDYVVDTSGTKADTKRQIDELIKRTLKGS
jgi:dephospho-CoA kinase